MSGEVAGMSSKFSSYFYRNPAAVKRLDEELRKELEDFRPVKNDPHAVLREIKRLQKQMEDDSGQLNQTAS